MQHYWKNSDWIYSGIKTFEWYYTEVEHFLSGSHHVGLVKMTNVGSEISCTSYWKHLQRLTLLQSSVVH